MGIVENFSLPDRSAPVLSGRSRELATLWECFGRSVSGNGNLALVSGEAGIGKTSLVQAVADEAARQGALVLAGGAYDLVSTPPYGPWVDLIARYQPTGDLPELPDVLKRGTGMGDVTNQIELFDVARDLMAAIAAVQPLVLLLEDIHWSDPASLALLRYLARAADQYRLLIIATYRDDEITPDHHLYQGLPALTRETGATRINLRSLDQSVLRDLVLDQYDLDEHDIRRLTSYLARHSEGNPLYFWELLRTLENEGRLWSDGRVWSLGDLSWIPVPSLLLQVIERRLDRVSDDNRRLLEVAAVIGTQIDLDTWQIVSGASDEHLGEVIEQSVASNLLTEGQTGTTIVFSHALVHQALYQRIPVIRRRRLHGRIAETLMVGDEPDEHFVAHHLEQAGDERAADWLRMAGDRAQRTYAILTAAERFARAAELLEGKSNRLAERGWLLYRAARQLRFTDPQRGIDYFNQSEQIARRVGDSVLEAFSVADRGFNHSAADHLEEALADMFRGNELIDALPADYIEPEHIRNWIADVVSASPEQEMEDQGFLQRLGRFNPRRPVLVLSSASMGLLSYSIETGTPYRHAITAIPNPDHHLLSPYADVCNGLAMAWSQLGEPEKAREAFTDAFEAMKRINHLAFLAPVLYGLLENVVLTYEADNLQERRRLESMAYESAAAAHHAMLTESPDEVTNYKLLQIEGRWDEAERRAELGINSIFRGQRRQLWVALGTIARARGDTRAAIRFVEQVLPAGPATEPMEVEIHAGIDGMWLGASIALDAGDLATARAWMETIQRFLDWSGAVRGRAELTLLLARHARLSNQPDWARQHAEDALAHASEPRQPLILIEVRRELGIQHADAGETDLAKQHLQESLELAVNCDAPYEAALTRLELADLRMSTRQPGAALELIRQVQEACADLGARPALRRAEDLAERLAVESAPPGGLTRREIEVLRLVAEGCSDPEVAEQLFISRRTVNTHLTSIYRKLDVGSRTLAAMRAREKGYI